MITSLGDGQIMRTDHDVALPGEDSNNKIRGERTLGERERKLEVGRAAVGGYEGVM